jgi:hypothetical protein
MARSLSKSVSKMLGSVGNKTVVDSVDKFILHNKYFLWGVLAFSLLNLLFMISGADYVSVVAFLLVGFVTSFFSKNMVVILTVSIVVANVLRFGARSVSEGMAEKEEEEKEEEGMEGEENEDKEEEKEEKKESFQEDNYKNKKNKGK